MKKILGIALLAACLFVSSPATMNAATSSLDNAPGGAGLAYWQASGGWQTLINIQEINGTCAEVHVSFYNSTGAKIMDFNLRLRPRDNVGIVVNGDGVNLSLYDYSDTAYGGTSVLNDASTGPAFMVAAPASTDGIQRGYLSVVRTNTGCTGAGGSPSGNITNTFAVVPDSIMVRYAILNPNSAFASNASMLQGFANQGGFISEANSFLNSTTTPNSIYPCDLNYDGDTVDNFNLVDDPGGADIDFVELFLSDNVFTPLPPYIICQSDSILSNALGSITLRYWARYNENASAGTETILVLVAPQRSHPSAVDFRGSLNVTSYDDNGNSATWNSSTIETVNAIPFGAGGISVPSGSDAGEARFFIVTPVFGFTFTETASFADLYPLVKESYAIMSSNQDHDDDAVDIITIP